MREQLQKAYAELLEAVGARQEEAGIEVGDIIKIALRDFVKGCRCPAIWAYGMHTRMLMVDYIFEMKTVRYIIDEFRTEDAGGFVMIHSDDVLNTEIDGIIISSFKYRKEIAETIRTKFPQIKYLDIYQVLHEHGIDLDCEYYALEYPYTHYTRINQLKTELKEQQNPEQAWELLRKLVKIKAFPSAIAWGEAFLKKENSVQTRRLLDSLRRVYELELQAASEVSEKNVLMMCIDGLRRRDLFTKQMRQIKRCIDQEMFFFENAYSVSTSTFESLVPTYSENCDLRTKYYECNTVQESDCRFVKEAIRQKRAIYFYTDGCSYIESEHIKVQKKFRTVSEKLWDFLLDAVDEENGLFYVHILYESHFSYPNPYTTGEFIADGTSIFFDFLQRNGGKLRADYERQKRDAMQYLDDLLAPFLERIRCPMVLFADHGNCLLKQDTRMEDIEYSQLTVGEELIQVPLVIRSPEMGVGTSNQICSIMDLNEIIIHLLRREQFEIKTHDYIKVLRSEIYNEDFKYLYRKLGFGQGLEAFEAFLFQDGWKLVIYANGVTELYSAEDELVEDDERKEELLSYVRAEVTVWA